MLCYTSMKEGVTVSILFTGLSIASGPVSDKGYYRMDRNQFHHFTRTLFRNTLVPICFSVFPIVEMYCKRVSHDSLLCKLAEMEMQSVPRASILTPDSGSIYMISTFMRQPITTAVTPYPDGVPSVMRGSPTTDYFLYGESR